MKSYRTCFGVEPGFKLEDRINVPPELLEGTFRCRIVYDEKDFHVQFLVYQYRKIESLQMVVDDSIDYHLKFADRSHLEALFQKKGECDDILIVCKGLVTDSFAANLVFFDGENWITPDRPLLYGTMRAKLLSLGLIKEARIKATDIRNFITAGLINAFLTFDSMPIISVNSIRTYD